jgi:hypothetical protein
LEDVIGLVDAAPSGFSDCLKLSIPPIGRGHWGTPYDVSADGSRIYFLRRNDDPLPREIHVIIGWRTLLD